MKRKSSHHLPGFKAKLALSPIKGDKTLAEIAEQFNLHRNQLQTWKKQLLEQTDTVFGCSQQQKTADEPHLKDLHAKIDERALENDFLSKALDR